MESVQINSKTYIEVYGDNEGRYLKIVHSGKPEKDKEISFSEISGYKFDPPTEKRYGSLRITDTFTRDGYTFELDRCSIDFSQSYEKKAERIKPYLDSIISGKKAGNRLREQIISELKRELKEQKENSISNNWTKWLEEMANNYRL